MLTEELTHEHKNCKNSYFLQLNFPILNRLINYLSTGLLNEAYMGKANIN